MTPAIRPGDRFTSSHWIDSNGAPTVFTVTKVAGGQVYYGAWSRKHNRIKAEFYAPIADMAPGGRVVGQWLEENPTHHSDEEGEGFPWGFVKRDGTDIRGDSLEDDDDTFDDSVLEMDNHQDLATHLGYTYLGAAEKAGLMRYLYARDGNNINLLMSASPPFKTAATAIVKWFPRAPMADDLMVVDLESSDGGLLFEGPNPEVLHAMKRIARGESPKEVHTDMGFANRRGRRENNPRRTPNGPHHSDGRAIMSRATGAPAKGMPWGFISRDGVMRSGLTQPSNVTSHDDLAVRLGYTSEDDALENGMVRYVMARQWVPDEHGRGWEDEKMVLNASAVKPYDTAAGTVIKLAGKLKGDFKPDVIAVDLFDNMDQFAPQYTFMLAARPAMTKLRDIARGEYHEDLPHREEENPYGDDWPPRRKLFNALAQAQRGEPESAMLRVQHTMGGGVINRVVEHVGDLTHRMSEGVTWSTAGYGYVKDKVEKTLRWLTNDYGFEREMEQNISHNAEYRKVDEGELRRKIYAALDEYADAHAALPVYNRVQRDARDAAVAVGRRDWREAISLLRELKDELDQGQGHWVEVAHEITMHPQANPANPGINKGGAMVFAIFSQRTGRILGTTRGMTRADAMGRVRQGLGILSGSDPSIRTSQDVLLYPVMNLKPHQRELAMTGEGMVVV